MSDERRESGRHWWDLGPASPPERFRGSGQPPWQGPPIDMPSRLRRPSPARQGRPPNWHPGPPPSLSGGPSAERGAPRRHPPRPAESTQPWRPDEARPGGGGDPEDTDYFVSLEDDAAEPERHAMAPAPPAREPQLLTHRQRATSPPPPPTDEVGYGGGGYGGGYGGSRRRSGRWSGMRRLALVACLLAVLAPVAAFFVGWLMYDVPSPGALAAQRKQVTTLYYADGRTELGRYTPEEGNRIEVPLRDVPVHVQHAVLAAEDRSFRSNPGFDIVGIGRAVWNQLNGGTGGGSTITQQYVKVATGDDDYSLFRKYREVIIAAKMTKQNSKDQILEDYLNTIYLGRGTYGVQAASQAYFGKNVADLTLSEGALLAAVIQSPSRWDPAKNLQQSTSRWNFVLDGMVEQGWLTPAQRAAQQFPVTIPPEQAVPGSPGDDRAHIVNKALEELEEQGFSKEQLAVDGGRIVTNIDARAQRLARDAVLTELDGQPENLQSALVAVDPRTGGVIAYYGGQDGIGYDLAGGPAWNPGSAFKPFAMLAALKQDIGMNSVYDGDSPLQVGGVSYANFESRSYNALTLREAMTKSVNTTFVQLTDDVGPGAVREAAIQAGIPPRIDGKDSLVEPGIGQPGLGITLGQYPVRAIDMAAAYATFAGDGMRNEPAFVREYVGADGNLRYQYQPEPQPAFDRRDADHNTQLARNVTATLTRVAAESGFPLDGGREVAAKTGTHQLGDTGNNSAAWTVGYTPSISTAVWVGDPANAAIVNANGKDIIGRGMPGAIWQRFMDSYLEPFPEETFPPFTPIGDTGGPARDELARATSEAPEPDTSSAPPPSPTPEPEPVEEPIETTEDAPEPVTCFPFDCAEPEPEREPQPRPRPYYPDPNGR